MCSFGFCPIKALVLLKSARGLGSARKRGGAEISVSLRPLGKNTPYSIDNRMPIGPSVPEGPLGRELKAEERSPLPFSEAQKSY